MDRLRVETLQRQEDGNDTRENDAFAASAVAIEQQAMPGGRRHPINYLGILREMLIAVNRLIHKPEYFAEESFTVVLVSP